MGKFNKRIKKKMRGGFWLKKYDYLIVGAGLFGAVFAYEMTKTGKKCLVIDKRDHIAGNIYCENIKMNYITCHLI